MDQTYATQTNVTDSKKSVDEDDYAFWLQNDGARNAQPLFLSYTLVGSAIKSLIEPTNGSWTSIFPFLFRVEEGKLSLDPFHIQFWGERCMSDTLRSKGS